MDNKTISGITSDELQQIIEKIERLEEDKQGLAQDISDVMKEAKLRGFQPKVIRQVLRLRKMSQDDRVEEEEMINLYLHALGMA